MKGLEPPDWPLYCKDPSLQRMEKPRSQGLTMVIDKGLGFNAVQDLFDLASAYIDIYKLGFGTCSLYPLHILQTKLALARAHHMKVMPGGTFFELASAHESVESYLAMIKRIGFNAIEISDGCLPVSREKRRRAISLAADAGFTVYAEFGKKAAGFKAEIDSLVETLEEDLAAGAAYVIVEARESGTVGVFNGEGEPDTAFLRSVAEFAGDHAKRLIWEAPHKDQQVALIRTLGLDVNLGNIAPADILSVETLRRGLRGDTASFALQGRSTVICD
jgi:phosphosulfolactate synthase